MYLALQNAIIVCVDCTEILEVIADYFRPKIKLLGSAFSIERRTKQPDIANDD